MVGKPYPPEFRADAVALYLSDPAHTMNGVARDLGISRQLLHQWVNGAAGVEVPNTSGGKTTRTTRTKRTNRKPMSDSTDTTDRDRLDAQLQALQRELAEVRKENAKLATERDILRAAAKFFAQEMTW